MPEKWRCALDDYPTRPIPEEPSVTIIIPIYNESSNVEELAQDVSFQEYSGIREIWFVDGGCGNCG